MKIRKNWFEVVFVVVFGVAFLSACGSQDRFAKQTKGTGDKAEVKATAENCKANKKVLPLGGDKCAASCSADDFQVENGKTGQCKCVDGYEAKDGKTCEPEEVDEDKDLVKRCEKEDKLLSIGSQGCVESCGDNQVVKKDGAYRACICDKEKNFILSKDRKSCVKKEESKKSAEADNAWDPIHQKPDDCDE